MLCICTFFSNSSLIELRFQTRGRLSVKGSKRQNKDATDGHNSPRGDIDDITVLECSQFQRMNRRKALLIIVFLRLHNRKDTNLRDHAF